MPNQSFRAAKTAVLSLAFALATSAIADDRPNVLIFLADDMGFSDLGCYGGEIDTPNLDALAANGLRSLEFYNTARCWPTRATLMSGSYRTKLDASPIIPEVLKTARYQTAMAGKWHLGSPTPPERGFDDYYGTLGGAGSFWEPPELRRNLEVAVPDGPDYYYTDKLGDEAVRQVRAFAKSEQPFFHYVAFTAPHWPLHAPEATVQKYLPRYENGWHDLRAKRYARMLELGIIDRERWPLAPPEAAVRDWETMPNKAWHVRNMAVYAAMLDHLDQAVGRVVAALRETKQFDNTLIMFFSDNGACREHLKGNGWNTANNVLALAKATGRTITVGDKPDVPNGGRDTYGSVGRDWANSQNTPLPRYKANVRAGGSLTSAIFHWPAGIPKAKTGSFTYQRGHVVDLMATLCQLADTKAPANHGRSLVPMLTGGTLDPDFAYYFDHAGTRAVTRGKFRAVQEYDRPWQLYDLSRDKTETRDLASQNPELLRELRTAWENRPTVK